MKLTRLSLVLLATAPMLAAAATLERTGQPIDAFFEKGNYAEVSYRWTDPDIPGVDVKGSKVSGDAAKKYNVAGAAVKFAPTAGAAFAVIYDQPWGVNYGYADQSIFRGAAAEANSHTITTLVGSQFVPNFWLYGGLVLEKLDAKVALPQLGYYNNLEDEAVGFIGGAAYEVPSIALRAALTYRSKIEHVTTTEEIIPRRDATGKAVGFMTFSDESNFDSPQSVDLSFQTGVTPSTLLMAGVRWVNWKAFEIKPAAFFQVAKKPVVNYGDDQVSVKVGVGQKLTNNLSGLVSVGYASGVGKPVSIFGPYEDKTTVVLGMKYKFSKRLNASIAAAYTMLSESETALPLAGKFKDGHAVTVGGKVGFHF